jgi:putative FmdB family regulatory protein
MVPTYEYKCPNGHVFELFQRMSDPAPETCPTCGAGPLEPVLYPVAVHFKGSGFYTTDYGRGSKRRDGGSGGGEKSGSGGESSSSTSDTREKATES